MSLTDAFLLDPYPFNVWIAHRGDGAGSGTASDPWDGAPELSPDLINITALGVGADPQEAVATATNGLADGDLVVVSGATGNDAGKWNGTFCVYGTTGNGFKLPDWGRFYSLCILRRSIAEWRRGPWRNHRQPKKP